MSPYWKNCADAGSAAAVTVIGAGAIGMLYGARLASRHRITLLCRTAEQAAEINSAGINLECEGKTVNVRLEAGVNGTELPPQDLVIFTVKAHQLAAAAAAAEPLLRRNRPAVCLLMNGGDNPGFLRGIADEKQILQAVSTGNSTRTGIAALKYTSGGITCIGPASPAGISAAEIFSTSGIKTELRADIGRTIWKKLFVNAVINPLTALHGIRNGEIADRPDLQTAIRRITAETAAAAETAGFHFDIDETVRNILAVAANTAEGKSSMLQDIRNGRRTEIDEINGFIVRTCASAGLTAPANAELVRQVHALEALRGISG